MSEPAGGLRCRNCGCQHLPVWRTTPLANGKIRRERRCRNCRQRMFTTEVLAFGETLPDVAELSPTQRESLWKQLMGWFL